MGRPPGDGKDYDWCKHCQMWVYNPEHQSIRHVCGYRIRITGSRKTKYRRKGMKRY